MARAFCVALLLLAAGCYESSRPLGPADQGSIDPALAGLWRCIPPDGKSKDLAHLLVVPFDATRYYLEWREDEKTTRYRAHTTQVNGVTLFNVAALQEKPEKWVFLRGAARPDGSRSFGLVDKEAVKAKTEAAALDEITQRVRDETLYKPWAICTFEK